MQNGIGVAAAGFRQLVAVTRRNSMGDASQADLNFASGQTGILGRQSGMGESGLVNALTCGLSTGRKAPTNEFLVVKEVASVGAEPLQQELIQRHQSLGVVRNLSGVLEPSGLRARIVPQPAVVPSISGSIGVVISIISPNPLRTELFNLLHFRDTPRSCLSKCSRSVRRNQALLTFLAPIWFGVPVLNLRRI